MQRRAWLCQSITGASVPACSITVYLAGTTTKAVIYSDQAGSSSLANPISAGTDGTYTYYAANGRYTEVVTAPGFTFGAAQTQDFILNDPFVAASPAPATPSWINAVATCTTLNAPTVGTYCFNTTVNQLQAYTGAAWVGISHALVAAGTGTTASMTIDNAGRVTFPSTVVSGDRFTCDGGVVGNPCVNATGQTNTGLYFPALNQVALAVGGTKAFLIDANSVVSTGAPTGAAVDTTAGHIEANINVPSAPGGFVCVNAAARALNVGCTPISAYAGGTQLGNLIFQALDATTGNVKMTLGLNTTAGVTNPIMTAVKDGSAQGTAFFRIGTGTAVNALEVANTLGPVVKLIDQNASATAGQLAFTSAGGTGYIGTTNGVGALVFRSNDVEKWRMETDGGLTVNSPTGGSKGPGTINASSYYIHGTAIASMPLTNASGTVTNTPHIVQDTVTLSGGTAGVALAGAAAFTNATSYTCVADDDTAIAAVRIVQNGGNGFTVLGTGSDVVRFICVGS